jgi:hypothetical protein
LHGDPLVGGAATEQLLLFIGQAKRHGHDRMVSR